MKQNIIIHLSLFNLKSIYLGSINIFQSIVCIYCLIALIIMLANLLQLRLQPYTTVFKAIQSYKNSPSQRHLHSYLRDDSRVKEIKKDIDYETINKNSKGKFTIREFVFQEKVEQNYIPPVNCNDMLT